MNAKTLIRKSCLIAAGYLFAGAVSLALPASSHATTLELSIGRIAADGDGKCGESKCGADKKPKPSPTPKKGEGKCGEGKCGAGK